MTFLSETIGEEIFLQGKYLNVAINSSGSIGSRYTAPTGIVTDAVNGYIRLGIMADMDGFNMGKKGATRDAMLQGSALEGFSIGYDIGSKHYVKANSERNSITQITGGDATDLSTDTTGKAAWVGTTSENVKVSQVVTLSEDAKYMKFEVTMTNLSGSDLTGLRYMRSIDADHGTDFKTINTIVEQGGDGADGALVAAYMTNGTTPLFYYTQDDRARVSTYGLDNRDPYAALAYDSPQAEGTSVKADQAININFALGTLAAGGSTTVTFYLGITDDLAATVMAIDAEAVASPTTPTTPVPPVVVEPVNIAPTAVADALTVKANGTGTGNVLTNDSDGNGDALTAALKTGPVHGTLTLKADGSYTYTPNAGYSGSDSFSYTASDGKASSVATVSLTVTPAPNAAPTAVADTAKTIGTAAVTGNVLANDSDADGDALVAALKTGPANGTVTLAADGSYSYKAAAGYVGSDSFTYTVSDGKTTSSATVTVTVAAPANNAPVAVADAASTVGTAVVTGNVLANDSDADGDALVAALKSGPSHGTVTLAADGSYSYKAAAGYVGTDTFTYTASDGKTSSTGKVTVKVAEPVNTAPTAVDDSTSTIGTAVVKGNVLTNDSDADGDALVAALKAGPSHGTVTLAADGSYSYKAAAGYVGSDSFTYMASDGKTSSSATVTVTVAAPANNAPTAVADAANTIGTAVVTGNVLANDRDADGDALVAALKAGPSHGTVTLAADGSYSYKAAAGYVGSDSFTYTASDGKATSSATVTVTVAAPANNAPIAVADAANTVGTAAVTGNVLANDSDVDGDALTVALASGPRNGTVALAADGSYQYTAKEGFSGVDTFTYSLSDGKATSSAVVTLTVEEAPVAKPPVVVKPLPDAPAATLPEVGPVGSSLLSGDNVQYGSSSANQTLTATSGQNVFHFDIDAKSGTDAIVGFGSHDLLTTSQALYDGNGDGIITWSKRLTLDGTDTVSLAGVKSLRLMGTDADGVFVYANGAARPKGALESMMGDDVLRGDVGDKKAQTFFFDTKLGLDLGSDRIENFGIKDRIVTTSQLDADSAGHVNLGSAGQLALTSGADVLGHVDIANLTGAAVHTLEFDGSIVNNGTTYYVYSMDGSAVGTAGLTF